MLSQLSLNAKSSVYTTFLHYCNRSHSTRRWRSTLKWQRQSGLVIFHLQTLRQLRSSLPHDVAHSVACAIIGSRLDYCNSLYYGMSNTNEIFKGYRECRMLPQELFAKLHDANITQSTFLRISIGYLWVAESTTRLPSSVIKTSNCNNLRILLVYSRHTDCRVLWGHLHQTYCQHSLHWQTLLLVGSHVAPHRLEQSPLICTHCWQFYY